MKKILNRARLGITSLETAVVIPVLLAVTLGAVDVARVIQAHQTLRDAAKVANRCVYPTDAACVAAAPSLSVTNMFQYELVSNTRETPRMDYSGTASWLSAPEMLFSNFQARVLSDVRFDGQFATNAYVIQSVPPPPSYAAIGSGNYLEMTRQGIPYVRFGAGPSFSPSYYSDPLGTIPLAPVASIDPGVRIAAEVGALEVGEWHTIWSSEGNAATWTPRAIGNLREATNAFTCILGPQVVASTAERVTCREPGIVTQSATENLEASRIAIDLDGTTTSAGESSFSMRVQSYLPGSSNYNEVDLRGRRFNGPVSNLLFPRGIAASRVINPSILGASGDNVFDNSYIHIPWGQHFRIQVRAQGNAPDVSITRLRIFSPRFAVRQAVGSCGCGAAQLAVSSPGTHLLPAQCPVIYTDCSTNTKAPGVLGPGVEPILYRNSAGMANSVTTSTVAHQPPPEYTLPISGGTNGCFATFEDAQARRNQTIISAGLGGVAFEESVVLAPTQSQCSAVNVHLVGATVTCPPNFGVVESVEPQTGRIRSSSAASAQCPPTAQNLISATNVSWGETVANIDHPPVSFTPTNCAALAPDWSSDPILAQYPKFISPSGAEVARHPVLTEHADPQAMKDSESYSCNQFALESREFDDSEEFAQSLFNGTHSNLGCDWEATLRNEAEFGPNVPVASRLKGYEFFVPASVEKGWDYQRTSELTCAACTSCRFSRSRVTVPGLFGIGSSPAECSGLPGGTWCESRAYSVATAGQNGGITVNETEAARIAFDELKATIPSAKRDCSGTDCAEVAVVADTVAGTVNASVTYNMPLYVLGNRSITLSSAISERFETRFSN